MSAPWSEPEIERRAAKLALALRKVAGRAKSEEDLRIGAVGLLGRFAEELGLDLQARHEHAVASGRRIDSVYGRVAIEFKRPGSLRANNAAAPNQDAIGQAQQYAEDLGREEHYELPRILAVCTDGHRIIFLRHRRGDWEVGEPRDVDKASVAELLFCLKSLQAKALLPDNLVEDFRPDPDGPSGLCVQALYQAITASKSPKVDALFAQWRLLFSEVCGYGLDSPRVDVHDLAQSFGVYQKRVDAERLFFSVHSYYGTLIKLLAAEIVTFYRGEMTPSYLGRLEALEDDALRAELADLEEGGVFRKMGVRNFLEGDFFAWYLEEWNQHVASAVRGIVRALRQYDPGTVQVDPEQTRDLLKKLYQNLLPKKLRHDLGEYYTPDWLAELVLEEIGYDGDLSKRILDPACGSGTFLVLEIKRARDWAQHKFRGERETLDSILNGIVGFDLNPLAVITARTNYLIALGGLLRYRGPGDVEIPVYLCDAVLTPAEQRQMTTGGRHFPLETAVGTLEIPLAVATRERVSALTALLEQAVRGGYRAEEFLQRARTDLGLDAAEFEQAEERLAGLYERLRTLDSERRNGIWARIIKNFFAPVFAGRFDYIAGNPPWINWQNLPDKYRRSTQGLWQDYGLFTLKGWRARMGGGKKDLSALFLYVAAHKYLKDGGRLGFLITQTLFKSVGGGEGFRRFELPAQPGERRPGLRLIRVHDLVEIKPFEGAANRTAVVSLQRGSPTSYPVPYVVWHKRAGKPLEEGMSLGDARRATTTQAQVALPIAGSQRAPWITGPQLALDTAQKVVGRSGYRGYEGLNVGGTSGVYWVRLLECLPGSIALVENLPQEGKHQGLRERGPVQAPIEEAVLFPLLRGRDVCAWRACPSAHIVLPHDPHTGVVYDEASMRVRFPKAYDYLRMFRGELLARSAMQYKSVLADSAQPFYWICNVLVKKGTPSLATWKVVWREVSTGMEAAVAGPGGTEGGGHRTAVPDHTLIAVASADRQPAHYLCAALRSAPARFVVEAYIHLHASPHVLDHIRIPRFDLKNALHRRLAELSEAAHEAAATDDADRVAGIEAAVDDAAAELWGITARELKTIQKALQAHRRPDRRSPRHARQSA